VVKPKFECPYCGELIVEGATTCPSCRLSLSEFLKGKEPVSSEKTIDQILDEIVSLKSGEAKKEERRAACPGCSWPLDGSESKCPKCGREFVPVKGRPCPICATNVPMGTDECPRCGAQLDRRAQAKTHTAEPAAPKVTPRREVDLEARLDELSKMIPCGKCGVLLRPTDAKCPSCGMDVTISKLQRDLDELEADEGVESVQKRQVADVALQALNEIEKQTRVRSRTRKLRTGKLTTVRAKQRMVSGAGLSNGVGQINGNGMINGRGRINGVGRTNGTGATNGRSFVNGTGISNGLKSRGRPGLGRRGSFLLKWQFLAVLIAIAIIIPTLVALSYVRKGSPYGIDGDFGDWSDARMFGVLVQSDSSSIAISEWSVATDGSSLFLYIRTSGATLGSQEAGSFNLFVDSDCSASTGYVVDALGADYMLQVQGWNGTVQSSALYERSGASDQYDWSSWLLMESLSTAISGTRLEAEARMPSALGDAAKYLLTSKDSVDDSSVGYMASAAGGVLVVSQEPDPTMSDDGLVALDPSAPVLHLRFSCQGAGGTVNSVVPSVFGAPIASTIGSFSLKVGETHDETVTVDTSTVNAGQLVTATAIASGIDSTFAGVEIVGDGVSAYAGTPKSSIVIDGAFADWTVPLLEDSDLSPVADRDINVDRFANVNSSDSSFFYVSVVGQMCHGTYVPSTISKPHGGGGGGGGVVTPSRVTAEDTLRIYIDSDKNSSTGYSYSIGSDHIGADYMVEVKGVYGMIVSSALYTRSQGNWTQTSATVDAMNDRQRIEIGVTSSDIGGKSNISYMIETTSWAGKGDTATPGPSRLRSMVSSFAGGIGFDTWPIDSSTADAAATAMSCQRKVFYDGTNYWSFYYDGVNTVHKYSTDNGVTWTRLGTVFKTTGVNEASVWYDSGNNIVYVVGDTATASKNVTIQKGAVTPATHNISWAASDSVLAVSSNDLAGKNSFISRDTNGYLWILSSNFSQTQPVRYDLTAFESTAANSITSWSYSGQMLASPSSGDNVKGSIVPSGSGSDVWAIYAYAGTVSSRKYTGTWQNPQTVIYTGGGSQANTDNSPPSAVVDSRGVVHVVYGTNRKSGQNSIPTIQYARNNSGATTFSTPVDLDAYIPADVGDYYPTISLDSSTDNLYVFWLRSDSSLTPQTLMGRKCVAGTWSNLTFGSQTTYAKQYLNSIYSVSGESKICWQWTQNTSSPIQVMFDTNIPEFSSLVLPSIFVCAAIVLVRRSRRRERRSS
jgi:hypothetical protein